MKIENESCGEESWGRGEGEEESCMGKLRRGLGFGLQVSLRRLKE
jgi:hypothetical protein